MFKTVTISYQRKLDKTEDSLLFLSSKLRRQTLQIIKVRFFRRTTVLLNYYVQAYIGLRKKKQTRQVYHLKRSQYAIHTSDILQCRT